MVVRVDRPTFDPVAVSSTAGGVQIEEDGYRDNPWQPRPFASRNEFVVSEALRLMNVPAEVIREQRPPFLNILFPPTMGYDRTPLTIEQVLETDRWSPQIRSWVSGTPRQPRNIDTQEDMWSGTLRGFNASPNPAG